MADFVLKIRLGVEDNRRNKKLISKFTKWLNQEHPKPSYNDLTLEFLKKVLEVAEVAFDGVMITDLGHNVVNDYLEDLRHPKLGKDGKWFLDDLQLKNRSVVWVKLENQWIKGRVEIKDKKSNIIIEPENVAIPISESNFLHW